MNKAFFLDRDGTINVDKGYIHRVCDLELLDGAADAIRRMNQNGFKVIVVKNQSGVARGYFPYSAVQKMNDTLQKMLQNYHAHIDRFYVCPHHPDGIIKSYNISCTCRKPGLLLFQQAQKDFEIDMGQSYAAGDKLSDIQDLYKMGIRRTGLIGNSGRADCYSSLMEFTDSVLRECMNGN